ncbi:hypothetical protein HK100_000050 [Physocladia obscura]|uniref:ABC transporter domain-containing protein n=1 Tax=Physocladia obscura TaxID=109957 RepID=A0AAD5TAJ0_9FUNG|nr:hypothetical protein HK100_000050 [Physocladia obscura]
MLNRGLSSPAGTSSANRLPTLSSLCSATNNQGCIPLAYVLPSAGNSSVAGKSVDAILGELSLLLQQSEPLFSSDLPTLSNRDDLAVQFKANSDIFHVALEFGSINESTFDTEYYIWIPDTVLISDFNSVGYTTAQAYVDRAILNAQRNRSGVPKLKSPLDYSDDGINGVRVVSVSITAKSAGLTLVFYMILMFQSATANTARAIANDKKLLRPEMVLMGMNETIYIIAVLAVQIAVSVPISFIVTAVLCTFGNFFEYTSWVLILVIIAFYTILATVFGYFLTVISSDSRATTGMVAISFYLGLGMFGIGEILVFDKPTISSTVQNLLLLSPHAVFGRILALLQDQEVQLNSVTFTNLGEYQNILTALVMLTVDIPIWLAISLGIENMKSRSWPINFKRKSNLNTDFELGDIGGEENIETVDFSAIDSVAQNSIIISKIIKIFPKREKSKSTGGAASTLKKFIVNPFKSAPKAKNVIALKGVSMNLHAGQTLALLGHNGSGKTTMLSILNGGLRQSSGQVLIKLPTNLPDGFIYLDTTKPTDLKTMRQNLGVCPQFDVLFPAFTCKEHLILYAALKGITIDSESPQNASSKLLVYIDTLLNDVDLTEKSNVRVSALSGGQKRKLSLAIALLGNPSIILLDEPTSGMDVAATEKVWKLIQEIKNNRTIIITTHSMEEADTLGDRIAILNKGQLQTVGTSMFLKGKFGVGFRLIVDLADGSLFNEVFEIVQTVFPSASLETSSNTSGTILLEKENGMGSLEYSALLSKLFALFHAKLESGELVNLKAVGLGQTTLEQVFLALKDQDISE